MELASALEVSTSPDTVEHESTEDSPPALIDSLLQRMGVEPQLVSVPLSPDLLSSGVEALKTALSAGAPPILPTAQLVLLGCSTPEDIEAAWAASTAARPPPPRPSLRTRLLRRITGKGCDVRVGAHVQRVDCDANALVHVGVDVVGVGAFRSTVTASATCLGGGWGAPHPVVTPHQLTVPKRGVGRFDLSLTSPGAGEAGAVWATVVCSCGCGAKDACLVLLVSRPTAFGLPPSALPHTIVDGECVPLAAALIGRYLRENGSDGAPRLTTEGVFRVAAAASDVAAARAALSVLAGAGAGGWDDAATYGSFVAAVRDAETCAVLLKRWLAEFTPPLLASVPVSDIVGEAGAWGAVDAALQPGPAALLRWLVRLLRDTAAQQRVNKMGSGALATCVAPCLVPLPSLPAGAEADSLADALAASRRAVVFVQALLEGEE